MSNEKIKNKSKDYFNLDSDDEDDSGEEAKKEELESKINKWDWDKPENFDLYYGKNAPKVNYENKTAKRSLLVADYDEEEENIESKNSNKKLAKNISAPNKPFIEPIENESAMEVIGKNKCEFNFVGHKSSVNRVHWFKKYENKNLLLSSSMEGNMMIWNLEKVLKNSKTANQDCVKVFSHVHTKGIRNAICSTNETEVISISFDQSCAITDIENGRNINRLNHDKLLTAVATHSSDEHIVMVGSKDEIIAWDIRENKPSKLYKSSFGQVQDLLFLNENEFISSGDVVSKDSAEYSIMAWDYKSTASISNQIFHEKYICCCLKKHPNKSLFYAQTHGNYIAEFSTRPPYKMNKFKRYESKSHLAQGYSIGFDINANGILIASGSSDGCAYIYNIDSSKLVNKIDAFKKQLVAQPCMDAKFQPNSFMDSTQTCQYLALSCWNGEIKIFKI